jgi:ribosomal protein S18 acetylase RimI-like enzyme
VSIDFFAHLSIDRLSSRHDRAGFTCGDDDLDRYFARQAGQDSRRKAAATFVLTERGSNRALGFYTLSATSVDLQDVPEDIRRRLPKYPQVPAIILGRLAVDRSRRGKRCGEFLLLDAFQRCMKIDDIGWMVFIVDAKNENAIAFYQKYRFVRLSPTSDRLILPRSTI